MIKQKKWSFKWLSFLCMMLIHAVGMKGEECDTIPLPLRSYLIGKEIDSIQNVSVLFPFWVAGVFGTISARYGRFLRAPLALPHLLPCVAPV